MLCTVGLDLLLTVLVPFLLFSPLFTSVCVFISTVCFLVRYLFWLLLSLGKTITLSPRLCRHFSIFFQWKLKHAIMKFFTWFWINIEQFYWTKSAHSFLFLFYFIFLKLSKEPYGWFIFQEIEYILHIRIRINYNPSFLYSFFYIVLRRKCFMKWVVNTDVIW